MREGRVRARDKREGGEGEEVAGRGDREEDGISGVTSWCIFLPLAIQEYL